MAKIKRAPARRSRASKIARGKRMSVRQKSTRTSSSKPRSVGKKSPPAKPKGGPVIGTPSPMRTKLTPELHDYARRKFETTEESGISIALDCGVDESVIRRMALREGWVRFVAPPRDLPPVAKLLMEVEALEAGVKAGAVVHGCRVYPTSDLKMPKSAERTWDGSQVLAPQDDGEAVANADPQENIERFIRVVMAHLDEFEAMRRDGKLLPKHHLATARAISILTEAFNKLQRLRAAQPGQSHDDIRDMPADLDDYRLELTRQIEQFLQSRSAAGAGGDAAAQPAEGV